MGKAGGWICFFMDTSVAGRMEETNMTNMPNNVALMSSAREGSLIPAGQAWRCRVAAALGQHCADGDLPSDESGGIEAVAFLEGHGFRAHQFRIRLHQGRGAQVVALLQIAFYGGVQHGVVRIFLAAAKVERQLPAGAPDGVRLPVRHRLRAQPLQGLEWRAAKGRWRDDGLDGHL